jgi:hypothetical protein
MNLPYEVPSWGSCVVGSAFCCGVRGSLRSGVRCQLFHIAAVLRNVTSFQFALKLAASILHKVVAVSDISELMEASSRRYYSLSCHNTQTLHEFLHV